GRDAALPHWRLWLADVRGRVRLLRRERARGQPTGAGPGDGRAACGDGLPGARGAALPDPAAAVAERRLLGAREHHLRRLTDLAGPAQEVDRDLRLPLHPALRADRDD